MAAAVTVRRRGAPGPVVRRAVWAAAAGAALTSVHVAVNLRLLRVPRAPGVPGGGLARAAAGTTAGDLAGSGPHVSVLVPARDEAPRVGACVRAVLDQEDVDLELLVYDDGSTDGTADAVRTAGGGDPRLRVLDGGSLPDGWLGKPHACAQLAGAAAGDVLVFVDADVVLYPGGLAATVALLDEGPDVVCPYPRQLADGAGPRLVQPLLQWSWLAFLPLRLAESSPRPSLVAANGQLLACRAAAYRSAGGHAAVRDAVLEDLALGRASKRAGCRVAVADGTAVASCRMYDSWDELVAGYTKSLWAAFGSPAGAVTVLGLLGWLYVVPPAAAVVGAVRSDRSLAVAGAAGYAAGVAGRVLAAWRTGGRPADALAHPVSVALLGWLTAASWRRRARGQLTWKGRSLCGSS